MEQMILRKFVALSDGIDCHCICDIQEISVGQPFCLEYHEVAHSRIFLQQQSETKSVCFFAVQSKVISPVLLN